MCIDKHFCLKKGIALIFLLFSLKSIQAKELQTRYIFNYITNNTGLTHNTVYDICQDSIGFMWFATEVGVNRYDGQSIKQYIHSPNDAHSLPSHSAICLVYTSDHFLFVGTSNGLAVYRPRTDDFDRIILRNKPLGRITSMMQGFGTEIIIFTENNGAFVFNYGNKSFSELKTPERLYGGAIDKENTYWVFSRYALYRFNRNKEQIATYPVTPDFLASTISYIMTDKQGRLMIGTFENGIFTYDKKNEEFIQLEVCKKAKMYYVRTIEETKSENEYWVGTESGLYIINTKTNRFEHYTQSFDSRHRTINDNAIYKIYRNKQGVFFAGTYFGGVNIANTWDIGFNAILPENAPGRLQGKAISMMAEAADGNLWIATEDAGIAIFDKRKNTFRHLQFDPQNSNSISSNNVHALLMDGQTCWASHFMGGISKINIKTGAIKRFIHKENIRNSLENNFVFALHFLSPDSILVGSLAGVDLMNKQSEIFSRFRENEFAECSINDIFTAPDGKIWFCTFNKGIFVYDRSKRGLMTHYQEGDNSGLTNNCIISFCVDSKKQIWIGTRNGGLLKYIAGEGRFEKCNSSMIIDDVIYGIVEDNDSFLWISTNKGISRLDFKNLTAVHFNVKHGIAGNQNNYKSYLKNNDTIYFGSVSGLTYFNPQKIFTPQEVPVIYFTNLSIFYETILPKSGSVLEEQIDFTKHLTLKHNQNSFTLGFSSINYLINDIEYQYYLEGFDETWSPLTRNTWANYTNITPGKYIFHIRAINTISKSVSPERILYIIVKPPLWASLYAYILYGILLCCIVIYIYYNYRNRQQEKMALVIEKIEKENLNLLHQHKMNFFTYISHEFKTPLSIIIASVEMLTQQKGDSESEFLQSIKRSANRLLSLVNQLMEFRKIETDHAVIHITKGNILEFSTQIINIYRPLLDKKGIHLSMNVSYTETEVFFDFDKLEKIITNLLTNAIKYTPENGNIEFLLNEGNEMIQFSVKDSGKGISERKKDKIFEAFYSEEFSNDVVESSGIGLALAASLIKLLKGEITVESIPGKGSLFSVSLPYTQHSATTSVREMQVIGTKTAESLIEEERKYLYAREETDNPKEKSREYTLVIAEDNKDLLTLLYQNFKEKYHVKCFENGIDAWEYINEKIPDIVITDIMMPAMSGIELSQKMKSSANCSYIPIVMLTAKDTKEAKLEGLQIGADAYITKPFSMLELEIRLINILNNQKALKNRLKELTRIEGLNIPVANQDQIFIEKVLGVIQNNLDNSELDVQFVADSLNMSRSNLHNKVKALMNMTSSEFINVVRLNKAKELITQEYLTFGEIAYKVGYNDSAYFTRIFKKHTGKTPTEYRQEIKESKK